MTVLLPVVLFFSPSGGYCAEGDGQAEKGLKFIDQQSVETGPVQKRERKIALILTVDTFDDPFWSSLKWPENDASELSEKLRRAGRYERIIRLGREKQTIIRRLSALSAEPDIENTTLLFYISTHGTLFIDKAGHIQQTVVLKDSDHNRLSTTTLPHKYIRDWFEKLPSKRKVLVLATCHSGIGKSRITDKVKRELSRHKGLAFLPISEVSESIIVLSASSLGETAQENDNLKHDVYTYFFLESFEKGDRNGDGAVVVSEAHDYARKKTYAFTKGRQLPTFESKIMGIDNIVLAGSFNKTPLPVIFSYSSRFKGFDLYIDGRKKGRLPTGAALRKGFHEIALRHPESSPEDPPYKRTRTLIKNNLNRVDDLFRPPRNFIFLNSGFNRFNNSFANTRLDFDSAQFYSLHYGFLLTRHFGVNLLVTHTPKIKKVVAFTKNIETTYESMAGGTGIFWLPYRSRHLVARLSANLLFNEVRITAGSNAENKEFRSNNLEFLSALTFEWSTLHGLIFSGGIEYSYAAVSINTATEKTYSQSLVGAFAGLGWAF